MKEGSSGICLSTTPAFAPSALGPWNNNFNNVDNFDNFYNFWQCKQFLTNSENSDNFYNFWQFTQSLTIVDNCFYHFDNWKDNPGDLWHLRHWLQFWQLRTWVHDNFCYQTIKSDTGQNSQFLMFEKTMTFRKHPQRFTLETCDLCNIWSGWWGDMTLPKWTMTMTLAMTFREHPQRAILEICDLRLDTWDTDYISDNWEQQY